MSSIRGKVCLVYGGSRGIGKAVCQLLGKRGANVVIVGRSLDSVGTIAKQLHKNDKDQKHLGLQCDITDEEAVNQCIHKLESNFGPLYALVNCAGILNSSLLMRAKTSDIEAQYRTNLLGPIFTCRAAIRYMLKRRNGHIVNIGSIVGLQGLAGDSVYSSTKAGLVGLTKSLAKEVGSKNIHVNLVCPGFVQTDMTSHLREQDYKSMIPLGRFAQPEEIAQTVGFLLQSKYITGQPSTTIDIYSQRTEKADTHMKLVTRSPI